MNKNWAAFSILVIIFTGITESKIKKGISDGFKIPEILIDKEFENILNLKCSLTDDRILLGK